MAADYPTSTKSFSTKVDNVDLVMAADINDIQTEVAAIETQLITSKLATLADAPVGNQVLTSVAGVPTWASISWASWAPTVTSASGAFGAGGASAACKYFQIGKLVWVKGLIIVTDVGTAGSYVILTLPVNAAATFRDAVTGMSIVTATGGWSKSITGTVGTVSTIRFYDIAGGFPAVNAQSIIFSAFYEAE